ncbi:MAG: type II toxin-antitoxin system HicB family antitoxin [Candidatus Sungbacteria bacterium]|nr:type II toxin-antitoxin system HicB family antitoxin [Candidatus Sungbacteria bacterium]
MKKSLYIATEYGSHLVAIEPDERRGYVVAAPALPGVITWGKNLAHAKEMVREAIELCIESLVQKRSAVKPTSRSNKSQKILVKV